MVIHALPPEEEVGWTPWERWLSRGRGICREDWVTSPARPDLAGRGTWYKLKTESTDLRPRFRAQSDLSLEQILRRGRIDEAAAVLSLDMHRELLEPMTPQAERWYRGYRWVVIPHLLAADLPVIYALPPMHLSDEQPWESWYSDDGVRLIHHVHFTKPNERATGRWRESVGAPQRPPEIFGVEWHWYNDPSMTPALVGRGD